MDELNKKNKEIEGIKSSLPIDIKPGDKIMTIIITPTTQDFFYALICKNTDLFSSLEAKIYEEFPKYSETQNYFLCNGKVIIPYKSLEFNKIHNSDIITLCQQSTN